MKNKFFLMAIIFILLIRIFSAATNLNNDKISNDVYENLKENNEVRVIIDLKEPEKEKGFLFKTLKSEYEINTEKEKIKKNVIENIGDENLKHDLGDYLAVEVSKKELNDLKYDSNVEFIKIDKPIKAFLQDSVPLINASSVWPIKISNYNITGIDETICVLDTGINFSHPDLIGKNKTCIIDCVGKACVENCSIADDNGHGTHVAGIISANSGIKGVALNSGLIGVKVLNSAGSGSGSDLDAGISWCIDNYANYNISVISMSLGTDCDTTPQFCYDSYCDSSEPTTAPRIDNATSRNISVIISSGNDNSITNISSPACIKNATAVAATDKNDNLASYSNRNNMVDLVAPGSNINSTKKTGGYETRSGTSMAAPHVAGAFVLIRQFFKLQSNRVPTPLEIINISNSTGKQINDTSGNGLNFSRINVYSALASMDYLNPIVNLTLPENNTKQSNRSVSFSCSASDVLLSNLTLYIWNSSGIFNATLRQTLSVNANEGFNLTLNYGSYNWSCLAYDHKNNFTLAGNYSLKILNLISSLNSPLNNAKTNQNQSFNCSAESESTKALKNTTFMLWNSAGNLVFNSTQNISGIINSTIFNYNFTNESSYLWNCRVFNNESDSVFADSNFTITYDTIKPNITLINPPDSASYSSSFQSITFEYNISDNSDISNCSLILNGIISLTNSSINNLSSGQSFTNSFSPGDYNWSINCTDSAGNFQNSSFRSFTINSPPVVISSSSGGGGSSPNYNTYTPSYQETLKGYTKELSKNDQIKFIFFDQKNEPHTLTVNNIKENYVNITVQSKTINLILGIEQSIKLNLTSADYYDIYIKLESIENNKARLTIQTIHEEIPKLSLTEKTAENKESKTEKANEIEEAQKDINKLNFEIKKLKMFVYGLLVIFIIVIIVILIVKKRKNHKRKKEKIKEYKGIFQKHIKPKT